MPFLPVIAGDDSTKHYWFNTLDLPAVAAPPASQPGTKTPAPQPSRTTPPPPGGIPTATRAPTLAPDAPAPGRHPPRERERHAPAGRAGHDRGRPAPPAGHAPRRDAGL